MAIDSSASQVATSALQAIPFGSIIGGPLTACVDAQAQAAQTTWEFIRKVGLQTDEKGNTSAINVRFEYIQGGRTMVLIVPLLTIVPIPYIAIDEIDINFKAQISASSSSSSEQSSSLEGNFGMEASASGGFLFARGSMKMSASVSSKKDSKATQDSKYSVEYTMDVRVHAGQDSMPAGMAKVLEILNSSVDTVNSKGELSVSSNSVMISSNSKVVVATYRSPEGRWDPMKIGCRKATDKDSIMLPEDGKPVNNKEFMLQLSDNAESMLCSFNTDGTYYITAGECKALIIVVK